MTPDEVNKIIAAYESVPETFELEMRFGPIDSEFWDSFMALRRERPDDHRS